MGDCYCRGLDPDCPLCGGAGTLPECTLCGGVRRVMRERNQEDVYDPEACPKCGVKVEKVRLEIGLTIEMSKWTFPRMIKGYPELDESREAIKRVIEARRGWVVMLTPPGRGKSYLLAAAINYALSAGYTCQYMTYQDMMSNMIEARMGRHKLSYLALVRQMTNVGLFAIDEFGTEGGTSDFQAGATREVLVSRSDTGGWMPTLFASNATIDEIGKKWPWLEDRFWDTECVKIDLSTMPSLRGEVPDAKGI